MIERQDGKTLITLGEGTVFTGMVMSGDDTRPVGIGFSDPKNPDIGPIIFVMPSNRAVASYLSVLIRFLEGHMTEADKGTEGVAHLLELKEHLAPLMAEVEALSKKKGGVQE